MIRGVMQLRCAGAEIGGPVAAFRRGTPLDVELLLRSESFGEPYLH